MAAGAVRAGDLAWRWREQPRCARGWGVVTHSLDRRFSDGLPLSPLRLRTTEDISNPTCCRRRSDPDIHAVARFSDYFVRSPDKLTLDDVRAYQVHLASKGVAWGSLNQVVCALRFFYGVTLDQAIIPERIPLRPRAAQAADRSKRRGGGALFGGGFEPEVARGVDDGLRSRAPGLRGRGAEGRRYRERPHGDADRERKGWQAALCHAVGAAA